MMATPVRPTVGFVSREEPIHSTGVVAREGHQGTTQMAHDSGTFFRGYLLAFTQAEDEHIVSVSNRFHKAKAAESSVTDHQWAGNLLGKTESNVP